MRRGAKVRHGLRPWREEQRGARDAQPSDPENADGREQQHGERWSEIVEDGAHPEPGVRRHSFGGAGKVRLARSHALQHEGQIGRLEWLNTGDMLILSFKSRTKAMKRLRFQNASLDAVDATILRVLAKDARMTMSDLARAVGLSPPSVTERVRRLEEAGVIQGYSAVVDPAALGLPLAAYIRIRPMPGQLPR